MLKKILIGLAVAVVAFLGFVATRPTDSHIERSATAKAPPDVVFANINSLERFVQWSPWQGLDPTQKVTFSGEKAGVGAKYAWEGNDEVGKGRMEIIDSKPNERIQENLEFIEPFASKAVVTIALAPDGDGTKITWGFDTKNDFMGKLFGIFVDMDAMLGKDFDKGLASLAALSEKQAADKKAAEAAAPVAAPAAPADGATPPAATPPAKD